jgi:DNA gyrase subunit B
MEPPFVIEAVAKSSASGKDAEGEESESTEAEEKPEEKNDKKNAKTAGKRKVEVETVEKTNARDLFEYVKKAGARGYDVQRYKGLGEMTAPQLWETTMDPERRTLLSVKLEDIAECETIFTTLMGEDVEARRKFIEDNALDVKNLDI